MFWKKDRSNDDSEAKSVESAPLPPTAAPDSADGAPAAASTPGSGELREQIVEQLRTVYDPEIPVNIYELGLVYKIDVNEAGHARIEMTLTSPACPSAAEIPLEVRRKAEAVEGVRSAEVEIVWDPPWTMEFMSEAARVQLGFF